MSTSYASCSVFSVLGYRTQGRLQLNSTHVLLLRLWFGHISGEFAPRATSRSWISFPAHPSLLATVFLFSFFDDACTALPNSGNHASSCTTAIELLSGLCEGLQPVFSAVYEALVQEWPLRPVMAVIDIFCYQRATLTSSLWTVSRLKVLSSVVTLTPGSEGLEGMSVDNKKPQKVFASSQKVTV